MIYWVWQPEAGIHWMWPIWLLTLHSLRFNSLGGATIHSA